MRVELRGCVFTFTVELRPLIRPGPGGYLRAAVGKQRASAVWECNNGLALRLRPTDLQSVYFHDHAGRPASAGSFIDTTLQEVTF